MASTSKTDWATKLTSEQLEEFKEHFEMFDKDGDGTITTNELGTVMRNLGQNPSQDDLKQMISEVDEDGTGDIDFDEFCTLMARMMGLDGMDEEPEAEESHKEAFKLLDQRGTGQISSTHFKEILGSISEKLSQSEINQIIEEIDPDHDGKINFSDFCKTLVF
ncbi:uncharacterized protein LOC135688111 isoform X1 [Rhopilema esculentum]|uniref:uncharacterized protein LOC135688111 isoform X1 n=1 Tax=Rhopilema esculentum TaxID=499914 RepID=UPI0031D60815